MSDSKTCPDCGTVLPPDAPMGICPKCLLKAGMGDAVDDTANEATLITASQSPADVPTIPPTDHSRRAKRPSYSARSRWLCSARTRRGSCIAI